jgi:hypothetical protein
LSGSIVERRRVTCLGLVVGLDGSCVERVSWSSEVDVRSFSRGRIRAESAAEAERRGRAESVRVVARRRWLQKRQCWVRIGSFCGVVVEDILRVEIWWMEVRGGLRSRSVIWLMGSRRMSDIMT